MKTEWRGTVYDVRDCEVIPGHISVGDWLWTNNRTGYVRVVAVQKNCPRLENLGAYFTMFTCEKRDGTIVPLRTQDDIQGKQKVLKRNRKVVLV